MRRLVTVKAFGSATALEALMARLDGAPEHAGWRRETFGFPPLGRTPDSLTFEAPAGAFPSVTRVSLRREAERRDVEVTGVEREGARPELVDPEGHAAAHDAAVTRFARDVLGPAAEAAGAGLCMTPPHVRIDDLVSPEVALQLWSFAGSDVRDAQLHPSDEARFLRLVAALYATRTDLDGDTLAQWLFEDVGWPAALTSRLARELGRGRALLLAHDQLRAEVAHARTRKEDE